MSALKDKFLTICRQRIKRSGIDDLLAWLEKSDFFTAPASTKYHGAYPGGLLQHSLNVYAEIHRIKSAYPNIEVPDESLAIVSLSMTSARSIFMPTAHEGKCLIIRYEYRTILVREHVQHPLLEC